MINCPDWAKYWTVDQISEAVDCGLLRRVGGNALDILLENEYDRFMHLDRCWERIPEDLQAVIIDTVENER